MNRIPFAMGVFLAAFATIALELMLTRIYSVTMYYHFAFMVISLALLGLSIAGVAVYMRPKFFRKERAGVLAGISMALCAVSVAATLYAAIANPISLRNWSENVGALIAIYFSASLPFLFSGFALTLAITHAGDSIGRIYAYDLIGAAAGCVFVMPALSWLGAPGAILLIGAVAAVSGILFCWGDIKSSRKVQAIVGALVVILLSLAFLGLTEAGNKRFGIARNPGKFLGKRHILFEKWNALSQVTVAPAGATDHRWIFIDADAATRMWSGDIKAGNYNSIRRVPEIRVASLVYSLRNEGPALVIGPGGGTDIISALRAGVKRVVGVEVNPIIVDTIMKGEFADYSGHLYEDARVQVVVDEGRSYIRRSREKYSSIQATLVDTWAASSSGAFTLTENTIYTVEAFGEFLDQLKDDGIVTVTRWYNVDDPKEFLRLVSIGRTALEERGVTAADIPLHFVLATDGQRRGTLLLSRSRLSEQDVTTLAAQATADGLQLLYAPFRVAGRLGPAANETHKNTRHEDPLLARFLRAPDRAGFLANLPYNAAAPSDDKPFFFYTLRAGELFSLLGRLGEIDLNNVGVLILLILFLLSVVVTALFVLLPLLLFRRDALAENRRAKLRVCAYFLCLGLGFILIEIGFMQRFVLFLGHPIYALAVVLAVLLGASGLGSALSSWGCQRYGVAGFVRRVIGIMAAVLLIYAAALTPLFHALLGLPLAARIALAGVLVFIPGLLMGTLLPSGVRTAHVVGPAVIPWAWGLNGVAGVVGSIFAILLSMNTGFTAALVIGVFIYLLGMLALPRTA